VDSKEGLFVLAIRHVLLLADMPAGKLGEHFPLTSFARHRHWDPDGAAIPEDLAADTAVDALIHALVSHAHLGGRP
jgi:hypothetical protein